jgi:hypothetical protein
MPRQNRDRLHGVPECPTAVPWHCNGSSSRIVAAGRTARSAGRASLAPRLVDRRRKGVPAKRELSTIVKQADVIFIGKSLAATTNSTSLGAAAREF